MLQIMLKSKMQIVVGLGMLASLAVTASAQEAKPMPKVTYQDHVRPILREHCFSCHNQDKPKGGLALDSFAKAMEGGASGEVIFAGDLESSRLWALVSHAETPEMPPEQDRLPDAKLNVIKEWILKGALENSGSTATVKKMSSVALAAPTGGGKPEVISMPTGLWRQPVIYTPRASAVTAIAASPWAPVVAIGGQNQIVLYNTDNGKCVGVLPYPEGLVYSLRFSNNGSVLLAGGGRGGHSGTSVLYDVKTGKRLLGVGDELDSVLSTDINDDHSRIAIGGPTRVVRIYSTQSGELEHEIRKHTDWVYAVRYSPDGVLLATADRSNGLFVWEAETAREYLNLLGHKGSVTDIAWRSDSNVLASASLDGTVKLWEMNDGKQIKSWTAHGGGVMAVAYTHDGRIVTAGQDKTVKVWSGDGAAIKTFAAFPEAALEATFSHDGKRVIGGDWTGAVRMWNVEDAAQVSLLPPNPPTLDMRIADAQNKVTAEVAALTAVQTKLTAAQTASTAKQAELKTVNDAMATDTAMVAKLTAEKAAIVLQVAALTKGVQDATAKVAAAKVNLDKANATVVELDKARVAADALVKANDGKVAAGKLNVATLTTKKVDADKQLVVFKQTEQAKQLEYQAAQKAAEEAAAAALAAKQVFDAAQKQRTAQEAAVATQKTGIDTANTALAAVVAEQAKATTQLAAAVKGVADQKQMAVTLTAAMAADEKIRVDSQNNLNAMNLKVTANAAATTAAQQRATAAAAAAKLRAAELAELNKQLVVSQQEAVAVKARHDAQKVEYDQLVAEKKAFEAAAVQLKQQVEASRAAADVAAKNVAALQAGRDAAMKMAADKAASAATVAKQLETLKAQLEKALAEKQAAELAANAKTAEVDKAAAAAAAAAQAASEAAEKAKIFGEAYQK